VILSSCTPCSIAYFPVKKEVCEGTVQGDGAIAFGKITASLANSFKLGV